jgi:hypothetical protein
MIAPIHSKSCADFVGGEFMPLEVEVTRTTNPKRKKGATKMPRETNAEKIARLEARVQELEDERLDALEALGVEIIDDEDEGDEDEESDEGNGDED